jgi:hypothetical protein
VGSHPIQGHHASLHPPATIDRHIDSTGRPSHFPQQTPAASTLPSPLARIGGGCPTVRRCLSTSNAAAAEEEGASSRDRYVSPHDWAAITRDYGKSDAVTQGAPVEIRTIKVEARSLEEQGSRYSRKLRKRGSFWRVLIGCCMAGCVAGGDGIDRRRIHDMVELALADRSVVLTTQLATTQSNLSINNNPHTL